VNWRLFSGPSVVHFPCAGGPGFDVVIWGDKDEALMARALTAALLAKQRSRFASSVETD
jgi:hypothetical protein